MKQLVLFSLLLTVCFCSNSFAQKKPQIISYVDDEEYVKKNTIVSKNSIIKIELFNNQSIDTIDIANDGELFQIDTVIIKVIPFGTRQYQKEYTKVRTLPPSKPSVAPYTEVDMRDYVDQCTNKITITFNGINKYYTHNSSLETAKYKSKNPYKFLKEGIAPESCLTEEPENQDEKPWWKFWG